METSQPTQLYEAMDITRPTQRNEEEYRQFEIPNEEEVAKPKKEIPEGRLTLLLCFAVLAAAFGSSFQFGYHIGNINIPADVIQRWFNQSHTHIYGDEPSDKTIKISWRISVGMFPLGGMIGGISVGILADKFGRKIMLLCNNCLAIIAAALMVSSKYLNIYYLFILGRLVIGLNSGLNSGLAPMYLMEISPTNLRGTIGSCAQLFITIAILFAQIFGLPNILGDDKRWPFIFAFTLVPVIVQLCTLPFCPESPKFNLIVRGRKERAEEDLKRLRQLNDVSAELDQINEEAIVARSQSKVTMLEMFSAKLYWPLALSVFMMISQQLSGINAAMFYSKGIFTSAGLKDQWPNYATIAMGTINVGMTVVSVYLVDRLGRRTLHISGMLGMCFSTMMITSSMLISKALPWYSFMSILFVLLFVISFATGPGSIPWFYVNELFPSNARGNANSIAVLTNWFFTFVVGISFEFIADILNEYSFLVFTALLIVFILFALKFLPETKNKSLEEVQEEMNRRRGITIEEDE